MSKEDKKSIDKKEDKQEEKADLPEEKAKAKDAPAEAGEVKKKRKKKVKKHVPVGYAFVKATFNNTIISVADANGNVVASGSAGSLGYYGTKKSTPYVAGLVANSVAAKVKNFGMEEIHVFVKGIGSGRESAVRALQSSGLNVVVIKDVTPLPHNGCRRKKIRRV